MYCAVKIFDTARFHVTAVKKVKKERDRLKNKEIMKRLDEVNEEFDFDFTYNDLFK
jgi:hypothetical protein